MKSLGILFCFFTMTCCGPAATPTSSTPDQTSAQASPAKHLEALYAQHFERYLKLNPSVAPMIGDYRFNHVFGNDLSDEYQAKSSALSREFLKQVQAVEADGLTAKQQVSRDYFIYLRSLEIEAEKIPTHLLPVNQFHSRALMFAQLGSGSSVQPFKTEKDYRDFMQKSAGFAEWIDSAIQRMREGIKQDIVLPKVLIERSIPQLQALYAATELEKSTFYAPLLSLPKSMPEEAKTTLIRDYEKVITETILPAYRRLHDFMAKEYLSRGKGESGMSALPGGADWYQYLIRLHTTTNSTPDEIHALGLSEVKRITDEMEQVRQQVNFEGDLRAFIKHLTSDPKFFFTNKEELITAYEDLKQKIDSILPTYFDVMPKSPYEVRPVEPFRERSAAGASYEAGTPDGSRPGIFYINTFNLKAQPKWGIETLSLHEAAPGHHFQISLQQEMQDAPKFQRFSDNTAFAEGWALYAESIGREMGLFTDPYQYFGRLSDEMLRAMRLVVDTGLHAKGWTREQAIQYMVDNSALNLSDITAEVERYMAIAGQALSYKVGQLKITELRQRAEAQLSGDFHLPEFHNQVLGHGSIPMTILAQSIERWMKDRPTEEMSQPH